MWICIIAQKSSMRCCCLMHFDFCAIEYLLHLACLPAMTHCNAFCTATHRLSSCASCDLSDAPVAIFKTLDVPELQELEGMMYDHEDLAHIYLGRWQEADTNKHAFAAAFDKKLCIKCKCKHVSLSSQHLWPETVPDVQELEGMVDDDQDMADMYLGRRQEADTNKQAQEDDH